MRFTIFVSLITIVVTLYLIITVVFFIYRKHINHILKQRFYALTHFGSKRDAMENIILRYTEKDEDFVVNEFLPALRMQKDVETHTNPIKGPKIREIFMENFRSCVKDLRKSTKLVIFSSNYLTSIYSHVDIKKIHSEMLKAENTVYIFVDIDPENSIYAFLKEQRDVHTTVVWSEPNFWDILRAIVSSNDNGNININMNYEYYIQSSKILSMKMKPPADISFSKLPEFPNMYDLNALTHSQV